VGVKGGKKEEEVEIRKCIMSMKHIYEKQKLLLIKFMILCIICLVLKSSIHVTILLNYYLR